MTTVAALYVDPRGVYANLPGVEVWGEARDARLYAGPWPVVAHPPCAAWCSWAWLRERAGYGARGDDGGCFAAALASVRTFGGVLEHPANSDAWAAFGLPAPALNAWSTAIGDEGYSAEVDQQLYGHQVSKRTWLYAVGVTVPALARTATWLRTPRDATNVKNLSRRRRGSTPPAFRDVLLAMARSARPLEPFVSPQ